MKNIFIFLSILSLPLLAVQAAPKSLSELEMAFAKDGYEITKVVTFESKRGIEAQHRTATNLESKARKKVYYLEGNGYQMGYLMGLLAQEDLEKMSTKFVDNVVFDFINLDVDPEQIPIIWGILKGIILEGCQTIEQDIPQTYLDEMKGLVDGAKKANPASKVKYSDLLMLNTGIDCLLSHIYSGKNLIDRKDISAKDINLAVMCNAFSVFGNATKDGKHYFGRDFMFPTAGVFQFTASMIIYNPDDGRIPMVAMAAPGFVGSIASMNSEGIGMGVDMSPSGNCNPSRPGLNSLLMVRHATHKGHSANESLDAIINAQRGVSWDYIVADGKNNRSCAVEAGASDESPDFTPHIPEDIALLELVPDRKFIEANDTAKLQKGLVARWNDYVYPEAFLKFNKDLLAYHDKKIDAKCWGELGYLNPTMHDQNCPLGYYFAPQRENRNDVLIMINHYVTPTMRMFAMNPWTALISEHKYDDLQYRYDELNHQILTAYGSIDEAKAIRLIDFLAPYNHPEYNKGKVKIGGSVSLCNLTDKVMRSHFGFYPDEWVSVTLLNYVE